MPSWRKAETLSGSVFKPPGPKPQRWSRSTLIRSWFELGTGCSILLFASSSSFDPFPSAQATAFSQEHMAVTESRCCTSGYRLRRIGWKYMKVCWERTIKMNQTASAQQLLFCSDREPTWKHGSVHVCGGKEKKKKNGSCWVAVLSLQKRYSK